MTLEEQFQREVLSGVDTLKKRYGYNPTYFVRMAYTQGGVQAAKSLLQTTDFQAGLITLWENKALEYSVENTVLDPKYRTLFSDDERRIALKRLIDLDYTPTW